MAGLGPAIHVFLSDGKDVDAWDEPGHDVTIRGERNPLGVNVMAPAGPSTYLSP
jgi:hypothetical protein